MTNLEMIEKLSQKAGVTKNAAEEALEKSNWDILDAMIYLEKNEGVNNVTAARGYSSANKTEQEQTDYQSNNSSSTANWYINKAISWGLENFIILSKNNITIIEIPIVFFILILIFSFSLIVILMIVGLFFNFQYSFEGPQLGGRGINCAMQKIYDFAQSIKQSVKK